MSSGTGRKRANLNCSAKRLERTARHLLRRHRILARSLKCHQCHGSIKCRRMIAESPYNYLTDSLIGSHEFGSFSQCFPAEFPRCGNRSVHHTLRGRTVGAFAERTQRQSRVPSAGQRYANVFVKRHVPCHWRTRHAKAATRSRDWLFPCKERTRNSPCQNRSSADWVQPH
jgi:hypothetical protein